MSLKILVNQLILTFWRIRVFNYFFNENQRGKDNKLLPELKSKFEEEEEDDDDEVIKLLIFISIIIFIFFFSNKNYCKASIKLL